MSKLKELIDELCPNGVEYKSLEELIDYIQPTNYIVSNTQYRNEYSIPVLTAGQTFLLGYTNEENNVFEASKEKPVIIFDDFTTSNHWVDFKFKVKSSAMKILIPKDNEKVNFRYLFFNMQNIKYIPTEHARQWIQTYSKFCIPVPPMEVQCEIVRVLDNFTLLSAELSAELKARQRQYEYYRNKLLTFEQSSETGSTLERERERERESTP